MPTRKPARRKEPKSIEDARALIVAMVPNGCRVYIHAQWSDSREAGRAHASVGYDCCVYGVAGKELFDVKAATPAGLVAAVHRAFQELLVRARQPAAGATVSVVFDAAAIADVAQFATTPAPRIAGGRPRLGNGGGA